MANEEIEFCKECGMEFIDGLELICPVCGNEVNFEDEEPLPEAVLEQLSESGQCVVCFESLVEADEWFWDYWGDFDSPGWLSVDYVWCKQCIVRRFREDHPDFEVSGLQPDTFLIAKEAREAGIYLGAQLNHIENLNAVRRLHDCFVSREDIVKWLDSDCPINEAELWPAIVDDFDEAMAWRQAGFGPDEETTGNWLRWECTPDTAARYVQLGVEYVPGQHYKELGVNLEDAVFYELNGFSDHVDDSGRYFVGVWLTSGLSVQETLALRDHIVDNELEFKAVFERSEARLKYEDGNVDLWEALPYQFEQLKTLGLPITPPNLLKYWGLSSKEILKVIDAGGAPGVAADVIRQGGSISKLGIVERLIELGAFPASATLLSKRGFLVKHVKQIEDNRDMASTLAWIAQVLKDNEDMKVDEAFSWLDVEALVSEVRRWRAVNFSAQEAAIWSNEGFNAETAKRWRDSGAGSAAVAKRRRDAGLNP